MTLSVLDENGFKVLGVDMLRTKTMQAGDGGSLLARTLNDLTVLAQAADAADGGGLALRDASAGFSPKPWRIDAKTHSRRVQVRDANGRLLGERTFPQATPQGTFAGIVRAMTHAIHIVNSSDIG